MNYLDLIIWILAVFGASNGIAFSALLMPFRNWIVYKKGWIILDNGNIQGVLRTNKIATFFSKLIHCPMCLGFWLGIIFSIIWKSPAGGNYLIDGFVGSASSWIIYLSVSFRQFNKP